MNITCSRRDEILKKQAAYEAQKNQRDSEVAQYRDAVHNVTTEIENIVAQKLSSVELNLDISCSEAAFGNILSLKVADESQKFDTNKALSWTWSVVLTEAGEIKKESSSWSGANLVSDANIQSLEEVLKAVKILNRIDWVNVLNVELPRVTDFVKTDYPKSEDFNSQLVEADIEEAIQNGLAILGRGYRWYNPTAFVYYLVKSESPAQYTVCELLKRYVDSGEYDRLDMETYRIKKSTFYDIIRKPIETVEIPNLG